MAIFTTPWRYAVTAANDSAAGSLAWGNVNNITQAAASADVRNPSLADDLERSFYLVAGGPPDLVPIGATVLGIEVRLFLSVEDAADLPALLQIVKGGAIQALNEADNPSYVDPGIFWFPSELIFGDSSSLWGETWAPEDLNEGFGVATAVDLGRLDDAELHSVQFRITYDQDPWQIVPGDGGGDAPAGSLIAGAVLNQSGGDGSGAGFAYDQLETFGSWLSPLYGLAPLRLAAFSEINWTENLPANSQIIVEARLLGDAVWSLCQNGGPVPVLGPGVDVLERPLQVRVSLYSNDGVAAPSFGEMTIDVAGAQGLSQGFYRNPLTGHLIPNSKTTGAEQGDRTFEEFVPDPVDLAVYDTCESDIGFDDRVRAWASEIVAPGVGEVGNSGIAKFWAYRIEGEIAGAMEPLAVGDAVLRYAKFRIQVTPAPAVAVVKQFTPTIDLLERSTTDNLVIAPGGSDLTFEQEFHRVPGVEVTAEAPGGAARFGGWENLTTQGVKVHVFDVAGLSIGGPATVTVTGV